MRLCNKVWVAVAVSMLACTAACNKEETKTTEQRLSNTASTDAAKIFVGGLSFATNEAKIRETFAKFGTIESVELKRDATGNKGFGFIKFASPEQAVKAAAALNGTNLDGSTIEVRGLRAGDRARASAPTP